MRRYVFTLLTAAAISAAYMEAVHITAAQATSPTGATLSPTGANMAAVNPNSLSSTQILQIQQTLRNGGFVVNLNGVWGPSVTTALRQFQVSRGLPASGTLTTQTVASLGVNLGTVTPAPGTQAQGAAAVNNSISPAAGGTVGTSSNTSINTTNNGQQPSATGVITNSSSGTAAGTISGTAGASGAAGGGAGAGGTP